MSIQWKPTVAAVQTALDATHGGSGIQTEGVSLRDTLSAAGAAYDSGSLDGATNTSPQAVAYQTWASNSGSPAWVELDRVCRYVVSVVGLTSATTAAFGVTTTTTKPTPLPFDVSNVATLTGRYTAAASLAANNAPLLGLLNFANATWTTAFAAMPVPNPNTDAKSQSLIASLNTALANANAWVAAAAFT
jgi:hypothetical protein